MIYDIIFFDPTQNKKRSYTMQDLSYLPFKPGVYFFKNKDNEIIYIGKAKSLRKRVASYFQNNQHDWKIQGILAEYTSIEYETTENEIKALILEAQLIQQHKPRFNVLLKDGSPFIYIVFQEKPIAQMLLTRTAPLKKSFVGPFINKKAVRALFSFLQKTFQLYRCKKIVPNGCLHYHIGLCAGSCKPDFNEHDYIQRLRLAYHSLTDNQDQFIAAIKKAIQEYNKQHSFEKAARFSKYLSHAQEIINTINNSCHDDNESTQEKRFFIKTDAMLGHAIQTLTGAPKPVNTIDCFDISHFQGKHIVGSCIRFANGIPDPHFFRHFKINSLDTQNDYAALQEIVKRRYAHDSFPDLIIIDGGKGQLSAVKTVIPDAFVSSIAKRQEQLFCQRFPEGIILDKHSSAGLLIIAIRNYAHHFAIAYYKKLRQKEISMYNKP